MWTERRALLIAALLAAIVASTAASRDLAAAAAAANGAVGTGAAPSVATFKDGEVLVQFKPNANKAAAFKKWGATQGKAVGRQRKDLGELVVAKLPPGLAVKDAVAQFKNDASVAFVEPNYKMTKLAIPNDSYWSSLWGMQGTFGIKAPAAWDTTTGSQDVYVAVVDEGIQYTHPDLAANMWRNPGETAGDGRDNDNNGYVDDVYGYDFYNYRGEVYSAADGDAHGTHCAGTIGGVGNNGLGVAGVNWNVKMISAKFLGPNGGWLSGAVDALDYVTQLKRTKGINIVATSNSWGCGTGCFSQALLDAINRGYEQDILFIAAAGNEQTSGCTYPACFTTFDTNAVIGVAALTSSGSKASYSNWGSWVHLGAPGSDIWSTVPTNSYASYSGTSMACPHVSGAAALYKAAHPTATAAEIKSAILSSVSPTSSMASPTWSSSGGRLNAEAMLQVVPASAVQCSPACTSGFYCTANGCANCTLASGGKCATCTSPGTCQTCATGWRNPPACTTPDCPGGCLNGQYCAATASGGQCQACSGNCASCITSPTTCSSCKAGWTGTPSCTTPSCSASCPTGTYCGANATGGVCMACGTNCATCSSGTSCTTCKDGFRNPPSCTTTCGTRGARCDNWHSCCSANCVSLGRGIKQCA